MPLTIGQNQEKKKKEVIKSSSEKCGHTPVVNAVKCFRDRDGNAWVNAPGNTTHTVETA